MPDKVRAKLIEVQRELRSVLPRNPTAWTTPESMHLTLRFLGNVPSTWIPTLSEKLGTALAGFGEFDLVSERLGCFPDLRYPRIVWAGAQDDQERLVQLHRRVNVAVEGFAESPAEERFVGHITLARPRQIKRAHAERLARFVADGATRRFGDWRVQSVALVRSRLSEAGARYEEMARVDLR